MKFVDLIRQIGPLRNVLRDGDVADLHEPQFHFDRDEFAKRFVAIFLGGAIDELLDPRRIGFELSFFEFATDLIDPKFAIEQRNIHVSHFVGWHDCPV